MGHAERQNEQAWAELYDDKKMLELAIVQRIERGMATKDDARYVAWSFGLTTDEVKRADNSQVR